MKPHQCFLERSYALLIEFSIYFQGLALFRQTQILRYTRHKNLQKQSNEDFLHTCLILAYILPTTNLLSSSIKKKFLNGPSF